jgi:glycine cleavage system transcriptional repressor
VAAVVRGGGNISDLTTRLSGELDVLAAELDLLSRVDINALGTQRRGVAKRLGVEASLRPATPSARVSGWR